MDPEGGPEARAFIIRCQDGDVPVSDQQAKNVFTNSEYFRNVFRHGTREAECGIVTKPDWSKDVGRKVLDLLIIGSLPVEFGTESCLEVLQAVDQLQLVTFEDDTGQKFCPQATHNVIAAMASVRDIGLKLSCCCIGSNKWYELVNNEILFWFDYSHGVTLRAASPVSLRKLYNNTEECTYRIFSSHDKEDTLLRIFDVCSEGCFDDTRNRTSLSIRFKELWRAKAIVSSDRFIYSPSDDEVILKVDGSFETIYDWLCFFREDVIADLDLSVTRPDKNMLLSVMESSRFCGNGAVSADLDACAVYLAKQTCQNIKKFLSFVLSNSTQPSGVPCLKVSNN